LPEKLRPAVIITRLLVGSYYPLQAGGSERLNGGGSCFHTGFLPFWFYQITPIYTLEM
jgi:hypothetical protein